MALRWGILATGGIAHAFASDLRTAGLDLQAVGSRSQAGADGFAGSFDVPRAHGSYEALADDPDVDIVYVSTPHPMHAENAQLVLEAGKHALVEKPFTLNRAEAERLRDIASAHGVMVMEAMWTRYLPHMRRIREIVAAGEIGEVRTMFADHTQSLPTDPDHRLNALELGGGALLDLAVYPISFVWDLLGRPDDIVSMARHGSTGADTEIATVMRHSDGALSTSISSSRAAGPNQAHIVGTEGRIDIDATWYTPTTFTVSATDGSAREHFRHDVPGRGMQFQALAAEEFVEQGLLTGRELPIDETVEIMGALDEIRAQIGVVYPSER